MINCPSLTCLVFLEHFLCCRFKNSKLLKECMGLLMLLPFRKLLKANIPFKITQELKIFKIFNSFAVP